MSLKHAAHFFCSGALLLLIFILCLSFSEHLDRFFYEGTVFGCGPADDISAWPEPLRLLTTVAPQYTSFYPIAYCLGKAYDIEYVAKAQLNAQTMDQLIDKWNLMQEPGPKSAIFSGRSMLFGSPVPEWWNLEGQSNIVYFASPEVSAGAKGDRFEVAYSRATGIACIYYRYKF